MGVDIQNNDSFDYIGGNFKYPGAKNLTKIGKALTKAKRMDLEDKFAI